MDGDVVDVKFGKIVDFFVSADSLFSRTMFCTVLVKHCLTNAQWWLT